MTKKDFEAIAANYKRQLTNPTVPSEARVALIANAYMFADVAGDANPRFDRDRFLAASGII